MLVLIKKYEITATNANRRTASNEMLESIGRRSYELGGAHFH